MAVWNSRQGPHRRFIVGNALRAEPQKRYISLRDIDQALPGPLEQQRWQFNGAYPTFRGHLPTAGRRQLQLQFGADRLTEALCQRSGALRIAFVVTLHR